MPVAYSDEMMDFIIQWPVTVLLACLKGKGILNSMDCETILMLAEYSRSTTTEDFRSDTNFADSSDDDDDDEYDDEYDDEDDYYEEDNYYDSENEDFHEFIGFMVHHSLAVVHHHHHHHGDFF